MPGPSASGQFPHIEDAGDPFRTSLMSLRDGVVLIDRKGRILVGNPAAEHMLGLVRNSETGQLAFDPARKFIGEDGATLEAGQEPCLSTLRTGSPLRDAVVGLQDGGGRLIWLLVQAEPVLDAATGEPTAVVCSFSNVTEARHTREALELAKREAEDSSRVKDKFVSLLAHDLRGPIASAITMVDLVAADSGPVLSIQSLEALQAVNERLKQQLELIDGVLSIARLRTGKLRVRKRRLPAGVLLSAAFGLKRLADQGTDTTYFHVYGPADVDHIRLLGSEVVARLLPLIICL